MNLGDYPILHPDPEDAPGDGGRRNAKRRPAWQILLAAIGAILVCFAAAFAIGSWRQSSALNAEIAAIRARGEPLRLADLEPPPGDIGVARGDALASALEKLKPLKEEFRVVFDADELPDVVDFSAFLPAIEENRVALDEIVRICREGDCRFRYDFSTAIPFQILLPHVEKLYAVRNLLTADVLHSLAAGDADRAAGKIGDSLLIASSLRHEPFYVSQNVLLRNEEKSLDLLEKLFAAGTVSSKRFDDLDQRLRATEAAFRLGLSVRAERAAMMSTIESIG